MGKTHRTVVSAGVTFTALLAFCLLSVLSLSPFTPLSSETTAAPSSANAPAALKLTFPGSDKFIDYSKYGEFRNAGTDKYQYVVKDRKGLAAVSPEGVDPNNGANDDPTLQELRRNKSLNGTHWDYTDHVNRPLRFYAWLAAREESGVRQYFLGKALEDNGYLTQAIQAYYAGLVLYPKSVGKTFWGTPLYISRMALDRIDYLTRKHPELGLTLADASVKIENGFDDDTANDRILVNPGHWVQSAPSQQGQDMTAAKAVKTIGGPDIQLVKYDNGAWQLLKDGKPFPIQAMAYCPTPVGLGSKSPGYEVNGSWQTADRNHNGLIDGAEECWVDKNKNNVQDPDETLTSDEALMAKMGVNTVRIYHHVYNKELLRKWHEKYGTMFMIGDFAGGYAVGSGVDFYTGTDYNNAEQQKSILEGIKSMVMSEKDEPYVLMWVLGNENVYGVGSNAKKDPVAFFKFINQAAEMIKQIDPKHPVAISSGDLYHFDLFVEYCPAVDIYGCNVYRGDAGMGRSFWQSIHDLGDRPVVITEYGNSAFGKNRSESEIEEFHKNYHQGNWEDITYNMAGHPGFGNALGGVAFEFCDEWWKAELFPQDQHNAEPQHPAPFCDGNNYEEWYGFYSLGNGQNSPFMRQPRAVIDYYTQVWNRP